MCRSPVNWDYFISCHIIVILGIYSRDNASSPTDPSVFQEQPILAEQIHLICLKTWVISIYLQTTLLCILTER